MLLRSTLTALVLVLGLASAAEAVAQSTETTTEQPRARSRSRGTTTQARQPRQPSAGQLAARQRMRDCGAEWRGIRGTAAAQNRTWREFSRECLRRGRGGTDSPGTTSRRRTRTTGTF